MQQKIANSEILPVNVVGSSIFGRYPKISLEKTYNMFISDGWLINYAGFKKAIDISPTGKGRGIFNSVRGGFLIVVISSSVYRLSSNFTPTFIGNIGTNNGDVTIDENLSNQICIVDGEAAYIYHYDNDSFAFTFTKQTLTFLGSEIFPGYVTYHNTFFLIAPNRRSANSQNWYAFERDTDTTLKLNSQFAIQTKPDSVLAVLRVPGKGNNILVIGSTVSEIWTQVGGAENYRRAQSVNIDFGLITTSGVAASDDFLCMLAQNENNGPFILVTDGSSSTKLSTDGIDYLLSSIIHPEQSCAFFYRQDGHLFFQLTFYNSKDNVTLIYDFTTKMFFHVSDENYNYYPARQVVFFKGNTYFISINDSSLYNMNTTFLTYDYSITPHTQGSEIPRVRICKTIRKQDSSVFRVARFRFWMEQGVNDYHPSPTGRECEGYILGQDGGFILTQEGGRMLLQNATCGLDDQVPRVDMSFSKTGNQSFSNVVSVNLNRDGQYRNILNFSRGMGHANEFTIQLRFVGFQRFVANDGIVEIY